MMFITEKGDSILELPNYSRLVTDCAKMQYLDKLLADLHRQNHSPYFLLNDQDA